MNKYIILILLLSTLCPGCDGTGGPDPPYPFSIEKLIYTNISELRQDSLTVTRSIVKFKGYITKDTNIVHFDTTYKDILFRNHLFESSEIDSRSLWLVQGNLPDTNGTSEKSYQTLTMTRNNGDVRTIKFNQRIPDIDSLISRLEQLTIKLFQ